MTVKFRRLAEVPSPEYQTDESAGFDIASVDEHVFDPGTFKVIATGLIIATPKKHFLMLTPRSSLFRRKGLILVNSPGIVDADYCGPEDEIRLALYNPTPKTGIISAGERIAQGILVPYTEALWQEVDQIEGESRGGFGSTG